MEKSNIAFNLLESITKQDKNIDNKTKQSLKYDIKSLYKNKRITEEQYKKLLENF